MDKPKLIYLLAASHSGSTLTAMLLNTHPKIGTTGELKAVHLGDPSRYRCSCKELLGSCEFWQGIHQRMHDHYPDFTIWESDTHYENIKSNYVQRLLRPLYRGGSLEVLRRIALSISPDWRRRHAQQMHRNAALIQCISAQSGVDFVVDSSKVGMRAVLLQQSGLVDLHVVRVIRDGRGVALTYVDPAKFADATDPSLRGGGSGVAPKGHHMSIADAAREWRRSNEEAAAVCRLLPESRKISIRYEDICADPLAQLNRVFTHFGLSALESLPNFRQQQHHVIGNGMRLDDTDQVSLDERWKTVLTVEQLAEFEQVAGELNRSLGYP